MPPTVIEKERDSIRERQRRGIEAARRRGVKFGRKPVPKPDNFDETAERWKNGELTAVQAMKELNLTRNIFYRYAREGGYMKGDYV